MRTQTSQHSRFRHPTILFFFFEESINDSFVSPYETRVSNFCHVPITWRFPRSPVQHFLMTPPVATVPAQPLFHYHPVPEPGRGTVQFPPGRVQYHARIFTTEAPLSARPTTMAASEEYLDVGTYGGQPQQLSSDHGTCECVNGWEQ